MNILLLGGGGREHALAWKLAQSPSLTKLWASPGNPGIAAHAELIPLDLKNHGAVVAFCRAQAIDLVVVGPEAPLVDGIGDSLRGAGIAVFGPSKAAAQLEGSKGFTKELCARHAIPTAAFERHDRLATALDALDRFGVPVVVKADGLAAGKGVTVAMTRDEAVEALEALFTETGAEVVIEEFLEGEEVSLFALSDGTDFVLFGTAQDHKRIGEGDTGPNTGGMGAYSPATVLTPALEARAMDEIVRPTVAAMAAEGMPFVGVLFAGLMLTADGPKLIEYNARFGDPETQVLMPRFEGDLAALFLATARGELANAGTPRFSPDYAVTVVLAAKGYPAEPKLGGAIDWSGETDSRTEIFVAGVKRDGEVLRSSGGRVIAVTASAPKISDARDAAYRRLEQIDFADGQFRRDIGWREVAREQL
ncbi:MAG: phosphoribosylamine--glycine ligase [Sphingomonadales bacterium]